MYIYALGKITNRVVTVLGTRAQLTFNLCKAIFTINNTHNLFMFQNPSSNSIEVTLCKSSYTVSLIALNSYMQLLSCMFSQIHI